MTQRERQILKWIEENPLISQQELADKAGITRSSVAVHISNLMKKGYITGKGYIVHTAPYVTVVGGVNMDIGGWPSEVPVDRDSNPGAVRMSLGGVGRNIAHNMSLLGLDVRMVTAFGDDLYAQKIAASCGELGIDISQSPVIPEGHTSTYLFINDEKGDMLLAVNRRYGRADYLPCIAWGSLALACGELSVGARLHLEGRLQSRVYHKEENGVRVPHTAYEVSIMTLTTEPECGSQR